MKKPPLPYMRSVHSLSDGDIVYERITGRFVRITGSKFDTIICFEYMDGPGDGHLAAINNGDLRRFKKPTKKQIDFLKIVGWKL